MTNNLPLFPMLRLRTKPQNGFSIPELLVVAGISSVLGIGLYLLLHAGTMVSTKAISGSISSTENRLSMDRLTYTVQQAYTPPVLVNHTGALTNGTAAAQGIRFLRYIGAPYVVTTSTAGLASNITSLTLTASTEAQVPPPAPQGNDVFIINTTALASGSDTQVMALVTTPITSSTSGNRVTYTVRLSRALGTTVSVGSGAMLTAILTRPTAFINVPTSKGRELRLYERFPYANNTIATGSNFTVITEQMALATSTSNASAADPMSDANARPFSLFTQSGRPFARATLSVRTSQYDKFLTTRQGKTDHDTFVRTESAISLRCTQ